MLLRDSESPEVRDNLYQSRCSDGENQGLGRTCRSTRANKQIALSTEW